MFRRFRLGTLLVLLAMGGCATPTTGHRLAWRTLSRGLTSGLGEPTRRVVRDEVAFLKLWAEHAADVNRPALPPAVDFEREMVVVVATGNRPTGGYLVEVVEAELRGRILRILVGEKTPQPGAIQIQHATQPFQFVALPAVTSEVRFRTVREWDGARDRDGDRDGSGSRSIRRRVRALETDAQSPKGAAGRK